MGEHDPLDEDPNAALRSGETVDTAPALAHVVGRGRVWRRAALAVTVAAAVIAITGLVLSTNSNGVKRVKAAGPSGTVTSSSSSVDTTTSRVAEKTTFQSTATTNVIPTAPSRELAQPTMQPAESLSLAEPPTTTAPSDTTTTTAPSPWPPGTSFSSNHLTTSVSFDPPAGEWGRQVEVTATITNPDDNWVFIALSANDRALPWQASPTTYCYTTSLGIDISTDANAAYVLVPSTSPTLQHQTSQGQMTGLLLAPHDSYVMSGQITLDGHIGDPSGGRGPDTYPAFVIIHGDDGVGNGIAFGNALPAYITITNPPSPTTTSLG